MNQTTQKTYYISLLIKLDLHVINIEIKLHSIFTIKHYTTALPTKI